MNLPYIVPTIRTRRTPFSKKIEAEGARAFSVYNHMMIPQFFKSLEEDYFHLKSSVQLWDVSCQRQIEIKGPDAMKLIQMTTPRNIKVMLSDQCYYIPMVDEMGKMINDPIVIKFSDDHFWISISDSDMLFYFKAASGIC